MVTLESSNLFSRLSGPELGRLRAVAQPLRFEAGQRIFKEGDAGDGLYLLQGGKVEISAMVNETRRQVFANIEPGEVFGEMAVVEDQPRSASAFAIEDSTVLFLPRQDMLELMEISPQLSLSLLREISGRLRQFNHQYVRELLQAERLSIVGRFARSIVHDLKNPLNLIGLTAEIAGMSEATPEMRAQAVATIRGQVERISDLISEILDFTQGAQPEVILAPVDYAEFVQTVVEELRPEAALKSVSVEIGSAVPEVALLLHPKRMRRVFYNLVHNAMEAIGDSGNITVRVTATATEVVTEVEDSGRGIAPEIAATLFEPFATFGKAQGTGLGLSICRRILDDHQGWIAAKNGPERGAIFSFGLPRHTTGTPA